MNAVLAQDADVLAVIADLSFADQQMIKAAEEEAERLNDERLQKLRDLCSRLQKKCDEAVEAKRPIEADMIRAIQLYDGMDFIRDNKAAPGSGSGPHRGPPVVKLVATRIDRWNARLDEMLFPTQEQAWDIRPDGDPEPVIGQDGQPIDVEVLKADADKKALAMKDLIGDQLNRCNFSRVGRRMNADASRLGTGLMMGPMNTIVEKRRFDNGLMALTVEELPTPEMREADPWCFFPDPTDRTEKAEFAFYVFPMGDLEVRNLGNTPGFDNDQIKELLKSKPSLGALKANIITRNSELGRREAIDGKYAVWRYTGILNREDLELLKVCECEETDDDGDDPNVPELAMVDLWYSGEFILSAKLSPVPNDYRIPYYVFAPLPREDSMFGTPLAIRCEGTYRAANAAFQMALVNASVSSAPMILQRKGKVRPSDGQNVIRGPKMFDVIDEDMAQPLRSFIDVVNIPSMVEQALAVMDRCIALMDEELNTSQWADASTNEDIQTAAGLAMTLNVRSIIQSKVAANADDEVFRPIIERMLWWNLDDPENDAIKGNYVVRPLVQAVRLIKDAQASRLLQAIQLSGNDPRFADMNDTYDMYMAWLRLSDAPTTFVIDKATWQANQANKQDPTAMLAEAQTMLVQAQAAQAQSSAMLSQAKAQTEPLIAQIKQMQAQADIANDQATGQLAAMRLQQDGSDNTQNLAVKMKELQDRMDMAAMKEQGAAFRSDQERIDSAELGLAELSQRAAEVDADLAIKGMELTRDAHEMAIKLQTGSGI